MGMFSPYTQLEISFFRGASGECGLKCAVFIIKDRKDCKDCSNLTLGAFGAKVAYVPYIKAGYHGQGPAYTQKVRLTNKGDSLGGCYLQLSSMAEVSSYLPRPLVKFVSGLVEFTRQSRSSAAIRVRFRCRRHQIHGS